MLVKGATDAYIWNDIDCGICEQIKWEEIWINTVIFVQENTFENIVCKMSAILIRPQCGKTYCVWVCHARSIVPEASIKGRDR